MKYNRNILGLATLCLAGGVAYAAPAISGYVDGSYNYNPANDHGVGAGMNQYDAYSPNANTFDLNTAHLGISGSDSATGVGYDVETDFGTDAALNEPNIGKAGAANSLFDVQQAFLTYAFGPGGAWGIKAGKYVTYEGIEVVGAGSDPTISRGLLYTIAEPVTHTGAEINYTKGIASIHLGAVNGWDEIIDVNSTPTGIANIGLNWGNPLSLSLSGLTGEEPTPHNVVLVRGVLTPAPGTSKGILTSVDLTGVTHAVKMVDINFQVNYGTQAHSSALAPEATGTWIGAGLQPLVHINGMWALGLRYEYLDDMDGARTGTKQMVQDLSAAPTFMINKYLTARVEYRYDFSNKAVFNPSNVPPNGPVGGTMDKNQSVISADLIATFF